MKRNLTGWIGVSVLAAAMQHAHADSPSTIVHDVAFKVGSNASIIWFEIDNPAVGGTLSVTNAPYASNAQLNGAVVDISRNRLIYDVDPAANPTAYAINLAGVQLLQNGVTTVSVSSLGAWAGGTETAGYRKADGNVYYQVSGTDELRYLNFNSSGGISGYTSVGTLNGPSTFTTSITGGDLDFDASGTLWMTGISDSNYANLWSFNSSTLQRSSLVITADDYNGMTFDATGTTMYAFDDVTDQYGIINTATGGFQTVLATDSTRFGDGGDLAQAMESIVTVPEPAALSIAAIGSVLALRRRRR